MDQPTDYWTSTEQVTPPSDGTNYVPTDTVYTQSNNTSDSEDTSADSTDEGKSTVLKSILLFLTIVAGFALMGVMFYFLFRQPDVVVCSPDNPLDPDSCDLTSSYNAIVSKCTNFITDECQENCAGFEKMYNPSSDDVSQCEFLLDYPVCYKQLAADVCEKCPINEIQGCTYEHMLNTVRDKTYCEGYGDAYTKHCKDICVKLWTDRDKFESSGRCSGSDDDNTYNFCSAVSFEEDDRKCDCSANYTYCTTSDDFETTLNDKCDPFDDNECNLICNEYERYHPDDVCSGTSKCANMSINCCKDNVSECLNPVSLIEIIENDCE